MGEHNNFLPPSESSSICDYADLAGQLCKTLSENNSETFDRSEKVHVKKKM